METHIQLFVDHSESAAVFKDFAQAWQQAESSEELERALAQSFDHRFEDGQSAVQEFLRSVRVAGEDLLEDSYLIEAVDLKSEIMRASFVTGRAGEGFLRQLLNLLSMTGPSFVRGRLKADEAEALAGIREGQVVVEWCDESVDEDFAAWWHDGRPLLEDLIRDSPRLPAGSAPDSVEEIDDAIEKMRQDASRVDWIGDSPALHSKELLGHWVPNAEKTIAAFRAGAERRWADMPKFMKELTGSLEDFIEGSIQKMNALMASSALQFSEKDMIRTFGAKSTSRRYVIDSIEDGTLHIRSRTNARYEVEIEIIQISFPEKDCLEMRKGKGKKVQVEIYDRVE